LRIPEFFREDGLPLMLLAFESDLTLFPLWGRCTYRGPAKRSVLMYVRLAPMRFSKRQSANHQVFKLCPLWLVFSGYELGMHFFELPLFVLLSVVKMPSISPTLTRLLGLQRRRFASVPVSAALLFILTLLPKPYCSPVSFLCKEIYHLEPTIEFLLSDIIIRPLLQVLDSPLFQNFYFGMQVLTPSSHSPPIVLAPFCPLTRFLIVFPLFRVEFLSYKLHQIPRLGPVVFPVSLCFFND